MFKSRTEKRKQSLLKKKKFKKASELSGSQLAIAFRRFIKNRAGLLGLVLSIAIFLIAIFADVLSPYAPLEPMAMKNYVPWYLPPGNVEGRIPPDLNKLIDESFEASWPVPLAWDINAGWSVVNLNDSGISGGLGQYAVRASAGSTYLSQDIDDDDPDEKLLFTSLSFMAYLDGNDSTTLSVLIEFANEPDMKIDINITNSNSWRTITEQFYFATKRSPEQIAVKIVDPTRITFSKGEGSDLLLDYIQFKAGVYFSDFHILGTNWRSHDLYSKLLYGSRVSLIVSVGAIIISLIIGLPLGLFAGYYRGKVDELIMRVTDIFLTLPFYFVMILVIVVLQDTPALDNLIIRLNIGAEVIVISVMLGLGIFGWMGITRLVRATILQIREMDYVEAARCLGASNRRIMIVHILPNILAPLIVVVTYALAVNIVAEAGLAFLGFTDVSLASWGRELDDGTEIVAVAWWPVVFPALFIITAVMAFNLLGDGLRDAFDPRLR